MFYKLKHPSKQTGKATVFVAYRYEGKETLKSTGVTVLPKHFNTKTGKISKADGEATLKQPKITAVRSLLESAVKTLVSIGAKPTAKSVSLSYDQDAVDVAELDKADAEWEVFGETAIERIEREILELERLLAEKRKDLDSLRHFFSDGYGKPFVDYIAEYKALNPRKRRESTLKGFNTLILLVKEFNKNLSLDAINLDSLNSFQDFLIVKGLKNRTIRVTISRFKVVYRYYAKQQKLPTDFFADFELVKDLGNDNIIYLTQAEVVEIESLRDLTPRQLQVQQQFLFACETALRHSDIYINSGNIRGKYLEVTMNKTDKTVRVPLTDKAKTILSGPCFPFQRLDTSDYDKALKAICKRLESFKQPVTVTHYVGNKPVPKTKEKWQLMSSHVARKTAINHWLSISIAETVVIQWAGHKNNKMLQNHYQHKQTASDREALKLLGI